MDSPFDMPQDATTDAEMQEQEDPIAAADQESDKNMMPPPGGTERHEDVATTNISGHTTETDETDSVSPASETSEGPKAVSFLDELYTRLKPAVIRLRDELTSNPEQQTSLATELATLQSKNPVEHGIYAEHMLMLGLLCKLRFDTLMANGGGDRDPNATTEDPNHSEPIDSAGDDTAELGKGSRTGPLTYQELKDTFKTKIADGHSLVVFHDEDQSNTQDICPEPSPGTDMVYSPQLFTKRDPTAGAESTFKTFFHTPNLCEQLDVNDDTHSRQTIQTVEYLHMLESIGRPPTLDTGRLRIVPEYTAIHIWPSEQGIGLCVSQKYEHGRNLSILGKSGQGTPHSNGSGSSDMGNVQLVPLGGGEIKNHMTQLKTLCENTQVALSPTVKDSDFKLHYDTNDPHKLSHITVVNPGVLRPKNIQEIQVDKALDDIVESSSKVNNQALLPLIALSMAKERPLDTMRMEPVVVETKVLPDVEDTNEKDIGEQSEENGAEEKEAAEDHVMDQEGAPDTGEGAGADNEGADNEGADNEGADNEGADNEGADNEGADNEGADNEGADNEGADNEGADNEGAENEGAENEGADNEGADNEGADNEGADNEGAENEGADNEGAENEGAENEGAENEGADNEGADNDGADNDGAIEDKDTDDGANNEGVAEEEQQQTAKQTGENTQNDPQVGLQDVSSTSNESTEEQDMVTVPQEDAVEKEGNDQDTENENTFSDPPPLMRHGEDAVENEESPPTPTNNATGGAGTVRNHTQRVTRRSARGVHTKKRLRN